MSERYSWTIAVIYSFSLNVHIFDYFFSSHGIPVAQKLRLIFYEMLEAFAVHPRTQFNAQITVRDRQFSMVILNTHG